MDDYLSRTEFATRDSGIQHSDEDIGAGGVGNRAFNIGAESQNHTQEQEENEDNTEQVGTTKTTASSPSAWSDIGTETSGSNNYQAESQLPLPPPLPPYGHTRNRLSLAPSLQNRSSLYSQYSPILEKATQVEFASTTNTISTAESDNSSSQNYSSNVSAKSHPNMRLEMIRESTNQLALLLSEIQELRRSTSERQSMSNRASALVEGNGNTAATSGDGTSSSYSSHKDPTSSPEDYSSSSFEQRSAVSTNNGTQGSVPKTTAVEDSNNSPSPTPVDKKMAVQMPPPSPPSSQPGSTAPNSSTIEEITSWKKQASKPPHYSHTRSISLPDGSSTHVVDRSSIRTTNTSSTIQSSSEEDFDGLISSLDMYRNRLNALNADNSANSQLQQQPRTQPQSPQNRKRLSQSLNSSPFGKQIGVPPSRPPPPTPPSLPPLSYSWQQQPSLKEEMDHLLDLPNPPFRLNKRTSLDSSAESFRTAHSPSEGEDVEGDSKIQQPHAAAASGLSHVKLNKSTENDSQYGQIEQAEQSSGSSSNDREGDPGLEPDSSGTIKDEDGDSAGQLSDFEREAEREMSRPEIVSEDFSAATNNTTTTSPLNLRKSYMSGSTSSPILSPLQDTKRIVSNASHASNRPLPTVPQSAEIDSNRKASETSMATVTQHDRRSSSNNHFNSEPSEFPSYHKNPHRHSKQQRHIYYYDEEQQYPHDHASREKPSRNTKKHRKHRKRESTRTETEPGANRASSALHDEASKRPFSQQNVQRLMDMAGDSFKLEELDLPPDEQHLLEKFVDSLSKLSVEINLDERKKLEGKRRLQNALRAIEGWI